MVKLINQLRQAFFAILIDSTSTLGAFPWALPPHLWKTVIVVNISRAQKSRCVISKKSRLTGQEGNRDVAIFKSWRCALGQNKIRWNSILDLSEDRSKKPPRESSNSLGGFTWSMLGSPAFSFSSPEKTKGKVDGFTEQKEKRMILYTYTKWKVKEIISYFHSELKIYTCCMDYRE